MAYALFPILLADYDGHMDWDGGWGVAMAIGMLLLWALAIAGIVWLVREVIAARNQAPHGRSDDEPLRILERRLADGSISPEEFRERRDMLSGPRAQRDPL